MQTENRPSKSAMSPQLKAFLAAPADVQTTQDGWGVHGMWTPGVRIMRNLKFQAKAILITVLFLIAALVEETNAAAGALTAQADELQGEIANFRVV